MFTNRKIMIEFYVNNLIIFKVDIKSIKKVKKLFKRQFEMKNEGEARVILNIQIQRLSNKKLTIN